MKLCNHYKIYVAFLYRFCTQTKLRSHGYRTPGAIKRADTAKQIEEACKLLPGDANTIWKAAGGGTGGQLSTVVWALNPQGSALLVMDPSHRICSACSNTFVLCCCS